MRIQRRLDLLVLMILVLASSCFSKIANEYLSLSFLEKDAFEVMAKNGLIINGETSLADCDLIGKTTKTITNNTIELRKQVQHTSGNRCQLTGKN
ncbi:hypothetical protein SMSP2_01678 [Limihaloglobus sulfuriphilus]|uniref:Uncharacterized protein n=1 Tax=Limihaloglobus sulfuriphilus TaxID=1851148 RepID=A0A1Q2MG73_9BACT|nr:hypothetical protein [Limihaloglobus sulfuriphilus]AQQ71307.1 hypothetical protein SMSP2_01678 [Limihaloglobus sulfuriphilus]